MKTDLARSYVVLSVCLGYGLAAWLVQMHRVAPPRDWLRERIWFLKTQISADVKAQVSSDEWKKELDTVEQWVNKRWLFLPVSRVQSAWRNVHGVEDERVLTLDPARVDEQLRTAQARLKRIPGVEAANLVKRIGRALNDKTFARKPALLRQAEIFRHNYNDTN